MHERATEHAGQLDILDAPRARKAYAAPQLTRWGAIPCVTRGFDDPGPMTSGLLVDTETK